MAYIDIGKARWEANNLLSQVIWRGHDESMSPKDSCNPREWLRGYEKGAMEIANIFLQQPVADVIEIKHGYWKKEELLECEPVFLCSICEKLHDQEYSYCNNCGAKMDLEESV